MKIISTGSVVLWSIEVVCSRCTSVLEVGSHDVEFDQGFTHPFRVTCPLCFYTLSIPESQISEQAQDEVKSRWKGQRKY